MREDSMVVDQTPQNAAERIAQLERELFLAREAATNAQASRDARAYDTLTPPPASAPVRLDLGCGSTPKAGFLGVDVRQFGGVGVVCDLARERWPWADNSVDEVNCSHMVEHIPRDRRPHFFNELWRVLKPLSKAVITTPHWASVRAYGDITHEWPPIVPFFWCYLDKEWRKTTPHCDAFTCDFSSSHGFTISGRFAGRNEAFVRDAMENHIDACDDMISTLVKVVR